MAEKGVLIAFSTGGTTYAKDLPYHVARAVAFGLSREDAIKAVTINPAKMFGLDSRLGSIEPGKDADLFIVDGDPLDARSMVKTMLINGKVIDLDNYWEKMYQEWKKRPI